MCALQLTIVSGRSVKHPSRWRPLAFAIIALACHGGASALGDERPHRSGHVLVGFNERMSDHEINELQRQYGLTSVRHLRPSKVHLLAVPAGMSEADYRDRLNKDSRVRFAELDHLVPPSVIPNDPKYASQWHLSTIGCPQAWDLTTGSADMLVAICDTGIDASVTDLAGKVRTDLGYNSVDGSSNTDPILSHGTWVAGVVAAATNNAIGVAGINWQAEILPIRITNQSDGYAYYSDAAEAIQYAADHGARVINLSYEMAGSSTVDGAAQYARQLGSLTVVAAGNSGVSQGYTDFTGFLAVSGTVQGDVWWSGSSFGTFVDIAAPAQNVLTTGTGGTYVYGGGTSFAAPIVAGVASLVWAVNPALSVDAVQSILLTSAVDLDPPGEDVYFGAGRVDAAAAVLAAADSTANQAPTVTIASPADGTTVEAGTSLYFSAAALDAEEGNLSPSISWTSTVQGPLGSGAGLTVALDAGEHVILATVLDSAGAAGEDLIACVVQVPSPCDGDGSCDAGEDCTVCPTECLTGSGASCGNGVCEAGDGEDCVSCPGDCKGKQSGKPGGRYCCGDGGGEKPIGCGDPLCQSSGFACSDVPASPSCCGDGLCDGIETGFNCELDCGAAPACGDGFCDPGETSCLCPGDCGLPPAQEVLNVTCKNGLDDDCDGAVDANDPDCAAGCVPTNTNEKGPRCKDGLDNDCDGSIDAADADC